MCISFIFKDHGKARAGIGLGGGGSAEKLDLQGTMLALSSHHYHTRERCTGPALTFIQVSPPREEEGTGETASRCMGLKQEAQRVCPRGKNMEVPPPAL